MPGGCRVSVLGEDPDRVHRINANSYQQSAIVTFRGWQYAGFYQHGDEAHSGGCFVTLARRQLGVEEGKEWEYLVFHDYLQTIDDGHNTISIGVCKGNGTIHVSFDHHCDELRYRYSKPGVATEPSKHAWTASLFSQTTDTLPGIPHSAEMKEVTYPRFVSADEDLLFSYRIGQAGLGSDVLYHYSAKTHTYTFLGQHLTGEGNSPYVNGMDYRNGRLHISWAYRKFIEYDGVHSANSTAHKAQAGPNGPENNYNLCYVFSEDKGRTWYSSNEAMVANLCSEVEKFRSITPDVEGIAVFDIPTNSGILNQEGQVASADGGFHALNREKIDGVETWMVYSRDPYDSAWNRYPIHGFQPTEIGARGSIFSDKKSNIYAVLPGNTDSSLAIVQVRTVETHKEHGIRVLWTGHGYDGEPLVDQARLDESNVLSIFTRTDADDGRRRVVVLDFDLDTRG